jgi:hypothetical protein
MLNFADLTDLQNEVLKMTPSEFEYIQGAGQVACPLP